MILFEGPENEEFVANMIFYLEKLLGRSSFLVLFVFLVFIAGSVLLADSWDPSFSVQCWFSAIS